MFSLVGLCVIYKVMCISMLLDDLEGINYDCSWWSVVWLFAHMLFFPFFHEERFNHLEGYSAT